jgi:hypothetical protein
MTSGLVSRERVKAWHVSVDDRRGNLIGVAGPA